MRSLTAVQNFSCSRCNTQLAVVIHVTGFLEIDRHNVMFLLLKELRKTELKLMETKHHHLTFIAGLMNLYMKNQVLIYMLYIMDS